MKELLTNSVFFGVMVSILTYELGMFLKRKLKLAIFNPLLISIAAVIVCLLAFNIDYDSYNAIYQLSFNTGNGLSGGAALRTG